MNAVPKFDAEKFRKVFVLINQGATDGERVSARGRAEAMATKAGMSFDEAVAVMNSGTAAGAADPSPGWKDAFRDMFDEGRKKREVRDAARRADALKRYRTVFEVFEPTEWERALRKAVQPFSEFLPYTNHVGRRVFRTLRIDRIVGEVTAGKLTRRARKAIEGAIPMPTTFAAAMEEVKAWDALRLDRDAFEGREGNHELEVEGRVSLLEEILNSAPVSSWDDMTARLDWSEYDWRRQWVNPEDHVRDEPFLDRVRADLEILRTMAATPILSGYLRETEPAAVTPAHSGPGHRVPGAKFGQRRTNADKAAAVVEFLQSEPSLSDREIGRLAGVSGQTVSNWRKRLAGRNAA